MFVDTLIMHLQMLELIKHRNVQHLLRIEGIDFNTNADK